MRVYGDGIIVLGSLGIDTKQVLFISLGLANAIAAGFGALLTQVLGDFSSTMGTGSKKSRKLKKLLMEIYDSCRRRIRCIL